MMFSFGIETKIATSPNIGSDQIEFERLAERVHLNFKGAYASSDRPRLQTGGGSTLHVVTRRIVYGNWGNKQRMSDFKTDI